MRKLSSQATRRWGSTMCKTHDWRICLRIVKINCETILGFKEDETLMLPFKMFNIQKIDTYGGELAESLVHPAK